MSEHLYMYKQKENCYVLALEALGPVPVPTILWVILTSFAVVKHSFPT